MTQRVDEIWAVREERISEDQRMANAIVWLMKKKKKMKWMLQGHIHKSLVIKARFEPT